MAGRRKRAPITLAKVTAGPGYEGRFEIGTRVVEDPYAKGARITVPANVRASTLTYMRSQGGIDEAQFQAGEWFRATYERAIVGACGAMDYTQERVDGGSLTEIASVALMEAHKALGIIAKLPELTGIRHAILVKVVGEEKTIRQAVLALGVPGAESTAKRWVKANLKAALTALVYHLGLEATGRGSIQKVRRGGYASGPIEVTGPSHEWHVNRFGHLVQVPSAASAKKFEKQLDHSEPLL